ncbi:MAG: addiction module toxin RelE [Chloroflexota bacterium]
MMVLSKKFAIIYPPIIKQHLKAIEPKFYSLIRESLEKGLQYQPDLETKNRRPLKRPVAFGARWEYRFGPGNRFRAFYRIEHDHSQVVLLAIGQKTGNRLLIGGEEVEI